MVREAVVIHRRRKIPPQFQCYQKQPGCKHKNSKFARSVLWYQLILNHTLQEYFNAFSIVPEKITSMATTSKFPFALWVDPT